ncbi:MAG TPA: hypothetical protein VIR27_07395 [Mycobacteriales bacterium]
MVRMSPAITGRLAVGAAVLMAAAACGGSGSSSDSGSNQAGSGPANSTTTVSTKAVDGMGTVLVDSTGKALYTSDQESSGSVKCVNDCTDIWPPLTVSDGQTPTGASGVTGTLGTVKRPDGSTQVTLDGKPLYRFSIDRSPGDVKGQGAKDSFGGVNFSWQVATASGQAAPAPTESSTPIYNY